MDWHSTRNSTLFMTIDSNDAKCNKIDEQSRVIDIQQVDLKCDAQRKKRHQEGKAGKCQLWNAAMPKWCNTTNHGSMMQHS